MPKTGVFLALLKARGNVSYRKQGSDMGVYERLTTSPASFTDAQLRMLTRTYIGCNPKGRNAQIPAKAFLILEARHSPTGKAKA